MEIAPHHRKIMFSFQHCWWINQQIGNRQCTHYLIVCALMISNFCFLVALAKNKNTVFREVVDNDDHENILLLALPALPQHGNGAVLAPR
jgi:hypothetical protein